MAGWLAELVIKDKQVGVLGSLLLVGGQSSLFIIGPATVCLHIPSQAKHSRLVYLIACLSYLNQ